MAFSFRSNAPLPQGFSIYQPSLGAPLQFFPALGTHELDDMMNAFIPGPASIKEKRATISLDFLEYAHLTGQSFKFYTVSDQSSASASSPEMSNASFNTSPTNSTSTWDFGLTASTSASASPRSSSTPSHRGHPKTASSISRSRPATDFSSLPGMKIMTKDGLDVTNSASRGSKTKEQRDHAHLMRIIKACDNCRRKKIRCDPSHKKRPVSQTQSPQPAAKAAKKARTEPQKPATADIPPVDDALRIPESALFFEPTFSFTDLDALKLLDGVAQSCDPWEEFVQFPPVDVDDNYNFLFDVDGYVSSQSPSSDSLSESPQKSLTPSSQQDVSAIPGVAEGWTIDGVEGSPQFPYMDLSGSSTSYTDFNLFSPGSSTFLEDELMVPISSSRHLGPTQLSSDASDSPGFNYHQLDRSGGSGMTDQSSSLSASALLSEARTSAQSDVLEWYDPGSGPGLQSNDGGQASMESMLAAMLSGKTFPLERHTSAENITQESPTEIGGLLGDVGPGRQLQVESTSLSSLGGFHFRNESSSHIAAAQASGEVHKDVSERSSVHAIGSETSLQPSSRSHRAESLRQANLSPSSPGYDSSNESLEPFSQSIVSDGRVDVNMESPGHLHGRDHQPLGTSSRDDSFTIANFDLDSPGRADGTLVPRIGDSWQEDEKQSLVSDVHTMPPMYPRDTELQVMETLLKPVQEAIPDAAASIALSMVVAVLWMILHVFTHSSPLQATVATFLLTMTTIVSDVLTHASLLQVSAAFLLTTATILDCYASSHNRLNLSGAQAKLGKYLDQKESDRWSQGKGSSPSSEAKWKSLLFSSWRAQGSWTSGRFAPLVMG